MRSAPAHCLPRRGRQPAKEFLWLTGVAWLTALLTTTGAFSGNLVDDPKGFRGIPWGSSLANQPDLTLADSGERVKGYDLNDGPSPLGDIHVDFMRFVSIEDKFARVIIRYQGKAVHTKILAYLQSQFGALDRTPGQMVRGLNQQYNWRGTDTEINLMFQEQGERGVLFFESRILAPRFNDVIPDAAY
ncbi:MAG: hypothetical protein C4293_10850 [Nitrospiraceae bacterium]